MSFMEFFNHITSDIKGVKGFMTVYRDALRYRYMITEKALKKAKMVIFSEKHGHKIALEAFSIKSRTLYHWKKQWKEGGKKPEALNEKKKNPEEQKKKKLVRRSNRGD